MATRQELVDLIKGTPLNDDWVHLFMQKLDATFPEVATELMRLVKERQHDSDQRQA